MHFFKDDLRYGYQAAPGNQDLMRYGRVFYGLSCKRIIDGSRKCRVRFVNLNAYNEERMEK